MAAAKAAPAKPKGGEKVVNKEAMLQAMNTAQGKKTAAARLLGISRVTLWKWLKEHDIH